MKRKVKKYAGDEGSLVKGSTNLRTRSDAEFDEDSKFGGYGKYMPKTKSSSSAKEDRPTSSGVDDYATMGKRAGASSPFSGPKEYISESIKEDTEKETESPKGIASGFKSGESKYERDDNEVKTPKKIKITNDNKKPKLPIGGTSAQDSFKNYQNLLSEEKTPKEYLAKTDKKYGIGPHGAFASIHKLFSDDRTEEEKQRHSDAMMKAYKGKKAGGSIKMASGGKTSSASSRGDGIAQRGKTKGRIC